MGRERIYNKMHLNYSEIQMAVSCPENMGTSLFPIFKKLRYTPTINHCKVYIDLKKVKLRKALFNDASINS